VHAQVGDDGIERREYDVDGERVVALVQEGRLVRVIRDDRDDEPVGWELPARTVP
jgi:hypothetical protein